MNPNLSLDPVRTHQQPRRHLIMTLACTTLMAVAAACDPAPYDALEPEWAPAADLDMSEELASEAPAAATMPTETFTFSVPADLLAVTVASDGAWAGFPEGIPALDEPAISSGFVGAIKLRDAQGNLVGFGTKQSVYQGSGGLSTFALTIPGRGTLMLGEEEDFTPFYEAIDDMISDGEMVRSFDPPLEVTTAPGAGKIIGGTGEFAQARGIYQGTQSVHELDLLLRSHEITYVIEISPGG